MTEPIDQATKDFAELKWKVGQILTEKFLEYNNGKFHLPVELNPAVHEVTEFIAERLKQERNKVIDSAIEKIKAKETSVGCPSGEAIKILESLKA